MHRQGVATPARVMLPALVVKRLSPARVDPLPPEHECLDVDTDVLHQRLDIRFVRERVPLEIEQRPRPRLCLVNSQSRVIIAPRFVVGVPVRYR